MCYISHDFICTVTILPYPWIDKKIWFHCNHFLFWNKANLRDLIAATCLVILLKLDSNRRFFSLYDLEISWMISTNYRAPLLHYIKLCASCQTRRWIQTGVTVWKRSIRVKIGHFLSRVTMQFDAGMTLKNNRTPLLCCFKLCASFDSHRWNQTKVTVRKRSIWVKISELLSRVTLKFDGWPWKTIVHLFYVALSFMHHFIDISELKIQSGSVQFRSKSTIVCPVWP